MIQQTLHLYRSAYQGLSPSVWLLAGVMLINRCGTMVLPFLTLYLTQHLHYSVTDAGIVMAVYGSGAFVGTFLGGRLTDRFGFYHTQLFSLLFSGFFLLGLQFVTHFYALCASVFIFTLLGDAFRPANQTAIAHYSDADSRTRAFSLNRLAINLGWAVGGGLGGFLAGIDYSLLFWVDGLTCIAAGLVLGALLPAPNRVEDNQATSAVKDAQQDTVQVVKSPYRDVLFLVFVCFVACYLMVFMQLFSIVPLFFKQVVHLNEQQIGALMALNGILIVIIEMALVHSLEQQKRSKIRLITWGVLLTAVSYFSLGLGNQIAIAFVYVVLVTISEMLTIPFIQSFTVDRSSPATRGQYLGLYAMGGALAQTAAPAFGSFMVEQFGFQTHWLVITAISLVTAGGFWWLAKALETKPHEISINY
ncbi:MDR family MFS transporter [Spirosoma soli]|uniref:MDR family MFS transporter n=1 Tax=Spirosoma soli TaxID=1770529 RepID=A0ABW5MBI1_9BACT